MYSELQIKEFNLDSMTEHPSILIIVKRGGGRKFLMKDLMHHFRHIPSGAIISGIERRDPFYRKFFPDLYIHTLIDEILFKCFLNRQLSLIENNLVDPSSNVDPSAIVVLDQCLYMHRGWRDNETIQGFLTNSKSYQITNIVIVQIPFQIGEEASSNFDYVFLTRDSFVLNQKEYWKYYANIFPTFEQFAAVFNKCTENYGVLVIDMKNQSNNIEDKFFWYRASEREFKFGSKLFNELHDEIYAQPYAANRIKIADDREFIIPESFLKSEYMLHYFMDHDKIDKIKLMNYGKDDLLAAIKKHNQNKQAENNLSTDDNECNHNNFESIPLQIIYNDNGYHLFGRINQNNHKLIKMIFRHMENMKRITNKKID